MTKREAEELIEIEIDGTEKPECTEESIVEQTYTPAECVSQAIDINEPIGNLKKLLEPRLQCSLDAHEICLQDIQLDPERSLFDQGVKTDGTVQLSVQVISYQGTSQLSCAQEHYIALQHHLGDILNRKITKKKHKNVKNVALNRL